MGGARVTTDDNKLRLAPDLVLPESFATEGVVVIGVRGSGKSNSLIRFMEVLSDAGIPWVSIDPKGDHYGIRMDGARPGLPIPVFGGLFGDFPVDESLGAQIADLLVNENLSAVIDVSRMSKTVGQPRFLTAFFNQLMERHQLDPHVRTVIFEEAHRYIPQQVKGGTAAALKEAAAAVLLEGRSFGLGCWACTQRPARLHNDVLEEVDTAIIHRIGVTATADLKRVRDWVKHEDLGEEIGASLTKLRNGEAWVLSPVSLGVVQRVRVDRRETFDSGATPVPGAVTKRRLATMADIDVPAVKEALAAAIEKAEAEDPKRLHARIRQLEAELKRQQATTTPEVVDREVIVEVVPAWVHEWLKRDLLESIQAHDQAITALVAAQKALLTAQERAQSQLESNPPSRPPEREPRPEPEHRTRAEKRVAPTPPSTSGDIAIGGPERKLLTVLACYGPRTKQQLAMQAGYVATGGAFRNPLGRLRSAGFVVKGEPIVITEAGIAALGDYKPLPAGEELWEHWVGSLGGPERKILSAVRAHPNGVDRDELAGECGYEPTGGAFKNPLGRLRTLQLVTKGNPIYLNDDFAEAIR
jgi:hypothetical protein